MDISENKLFHPELNINTTVVDIAPVIIAIIGLWIYRMSSIYSPKI
jgi:hypothetical protein